jgi:hypothetical protein
MTTTLSAVIVNAGLITEETLEQFRRWGMPLPEGYAPNLSKPEEVVFAIERILQSEGYVLTRETDLEILTRYMHARQTGLLHLVIPEDGGEETDVPCEFARTELGEYILPHRGSIVSELLVNGKTYLIAGGRKVFFQSARDLFYGEQKVFVVCQSNYSEEIPST